MTGLGPLGDGARVLIVGGGPGGAACALGLLRGARANGKRVHVQILQASHIAPQHNQCVGVLSPPLQEVLRAELGLELPPPLLQRRVTAYALHGDAQSLRLPLDEEAGTFASPRVELDAFLLDAARAAGAQVTPCRAYDLDVRADGVTVHADTGLLSGDVLVGAFGLDPMLGRALHQRVGYTTPPHLEAVVANISPHPRDPMPLLLHDTVHAFLPTDKRFEFGALIPNVSHATVVVAGLHLAGDALEAFLNHPAVPGLLGERARPDDQFRATFPNGLAQHAYGDRFVTIGDAAGLVRPFKGKGIYAAAITGLRAARTMLQVGISREAFGHYRTECQDLVTDVQYGRLVRRLALLLAKGFSFDPVLARARDDPNLRRALFLAVSGHGTSREIFWLGARPRTAFGLALACAT